MSNFDNILTSLMAATEEVGKKANETIEISKLNVERAKVKNRVRENYQRLGEIVYGGYKNEEDVSDITAVLFEQLDEDFDRIEDIYNQICAIKAGAGDGIIDISEDEMTEMEEEAEEAEEMLNEAEAIPAAEEAEEAEEANEEVENRKKAFAAGIEMEAD